MMLILLCNVKNFVTEQGYCRLRRMSHWSEGYIGNLWAMLRAPSVLVRVFLWAHWALLRNACKPACIHMGGDLLLVGWFPMLEMINCQCRQVDVRGDFALRCQDFWHLAKGRFGWCPLLPMIIWQCRQGWREADGRDEAFSPLVRFPTFPTSNIHNLLHLLHCPFALNVPHKAQSQKN